MVSKATDVVALILFCFYAYCEQATERVVVVVIGEN